jgi:polyhydroxybutyrate depolymerase
MSIQRPRSRATLICIFLLTVVCVATARFESSATAQPQPEQAAPPRRGKRAEAVLKDLTRREWTVGETAREALFHVPMTAKSEPAPVVFAFHGHGGTMQRAAAMFHYHDVWPEAIVVYMQGLNTPGRLTDPEGKKPGWQNTPGSQGDRDLKFFDAVLASLKADYKVDDSRIYATGHSNGGGFTYLLWRTRGDVFAAIAPSAASGPGAEWAKRLADLKPKPVLHLAGEKDALVKYEWQQVTMETLRKLNGCEPTGSEWAKWCTLYPSKTGTPVITLIHPGAHNFPPEASALFVKFFKEHAKK